MGVSAAGVDLFDAQSYVVCEFVEAGARYDFVGVGDAASREGLTQEEFVLMVWLGEREVRSNVSFKKVTEGDLSGCHVPPWGGV